MRLTPLPACVFIKGIHYPARPFGSPSPFLPPFWHDVAAESVSFKKSGMKIGAERCIGGAPVDVLAKVMVKLFG